MTAQGTTPLSGTPLNDVDFASRLVRVPKGAGSPGGPAAGSFKKVLAETINGGGAPRSTAGAKQDKRLWDACIEMESILVGKMLKEMRKTVNKSGWLNGGFAEEIFEDMLYDEYAMNMSRNSNLGMAKMLYEELKRKV